MEAARHDLWRRPGFGSAAKSCSRYASIVYSEDRLRVGDDGLAYAAASYRSRQFSDVAAPGGDRSDCWDFRSSTSGWTALFGWRAASKLASLGGGRIRRYQGAGDQCSTGGSGNYREDFRRSRTAHLTVPPGGAVFDRSNYSSARRAAWFAFRDALLEPRERGEVDRPRRIGRFVIKTFHFELI